MPREGGAASAVFDTNICLDFFVFHDPVSCRLLDAVREGRLRAFTRADCREEFLAVLGYPEFRLDGDAREKAAAEFDRHIALIAPEARDRRLLPACTDADDQKFMEAAYDGRAGFLFTKDKALLKLARKNRKNGLFRIMAPAAWVRENQ